MDLRVISIKPKFAKVERVSVKYVWSFMERILTPRSQFLATA